MLVLLLLLTMTSTMTWRRAVRMTGSTLVIRVSVWELLNRQTLHVMRIGPARAQRHPAVCRCVHAA